MDKIWSDQQCDYWESYRVDLTKCKEKCRSTQRCTAINHRPETQDCDLRACSLPVSSPELKILNYQGYYLASRKI